MSEPALLNAIFEAGITAVRQKAELAGYAEIASAQSEAELRQHRSESRRRRPTWAQDA